MLELLQSEENRRQIRAKLFKVLGNSIYQVLNPFITSYLNKMMTKNHRKISDIFETQFSIVLQVSTQIINCNVCFNGLEAKKNPISLPWVWEVKIYPFISVYPDTCCETWWGKLLRNIVRIYVRASARYGEVFQPKSYFHVINIY